MLELATKFLPDPQAFQVAYQAGFRGAEFWLDAGLLCDWQTILSTACKYPFTYVLHFPNRGPLEGKAIQGAVLLYRELKCRAMVIHQRMYDKHAEAILAMEPSLRLALENHALDRPGFDRWAERNPWLTLDVEHLWMATLRKAPLDKLLAALGDFLSRCGEKLLHVHLPGYRIGGKEHCPVHHSPEMATGVLTLLADHGFSGLVVSEADQEFQNLDDLRQDTALFANWRTQYASQARSGTSEGSTIPCQD